MLHKPIEMICIHDESGQIRPYRFRMRDETDEMITVNIKKIVDRKAEKVKSTYYMTGVNCLIFYCQCILNDALRTLEIQFRKDTCRWYLAGFK